MRTNFTICSTYANKYNPLGENRNGACTGVIALIKTSDRAAEKLKSRLEPWLLIEKGMSGAHSFCVKKVGLHELAPQQKQIKFNEY